jgi:hypothetical protein
LRRRAYRLSSKRSTRALRHRSNSQPQGSTRLLPVAASATHRSARRLLSSQTDSDPGPATGTARDCFRTPAATRPERAAWLLRSREGPLDGAGAAQAVGDLAIPFEVDHSPSVTGAHAWIVATAITHSSAGKTANAIVRHAAAQCSSWANSKVRARAGDGGLKAGCVTDVRRGAGGEDHAR